MDRCLCAKLSIDFYRSHLSQRILNKIAQIQKCDCLRFEFPDVCVTTNLKFKFENDCSDSFSEFKCDDKDVNKLFYEEIIIKKGSILMFFAITKQHKESPKRCYSFLGTLKQLKRELKPYYEFFDPCSILEFSDNEDFQTLPTLPILKSEPKTNIMVSNLVTLRDVKDHFLKKIKNNQPNLSLSETEQRFFDYCLKKIDASIAKKSEGAEIIFRESSAMKILYGTKGGIDKIYSLVEAHYFNNFEIGVSFGGYDLGTGVDIKYNKPNEDIDKSDKDFQHNYNLLLNFYMTHLDDAHLHPHPNLNPMMGSLWFHMYLDLKQELNKVGYTLVLDHCGEYYPQKIQKM